MATPIRHGELVFKWHGLKELDNALKQLPSAFHKQVLNAALRKAGKPVVDHVRSSGDTPRRSGFLAASVKVGTSLSRRQKRSRIKEAQAEVFIGPTYPYGAHGHLLEFGTVKMKARPFMRPAWDATKHQVLKIFAEELKKAISRKAKSLAKKGIPVG